MKSVVSTCITMVIEMGTLLATAQLWSAQVPTRRGMDQENGAHIHKGVLFSHQEKQTQCPHPFWKVNGTGGHFVKQNMPD